MVKISGISQNVGVYSGNLVDLFVPNQNSFLLSLQVGERINAKALWQDNKLTASQITVQGSPSNQSSSQNNTGISNQSNSNPAQNIIQNLPGNFQRGHSGKPF